MENQIKSAFDSITMSQECRDKIYEAMKTRSHRINVMRRVQCAAVAMLLVLSFCLLINPTVTNAVADAFEAVKSKLSIMLGNGPLVILEDDYFYYNDGHLQINNSLGNSQSTVSTENPAFLRCRGDQLYFLANGEYINITDKIADDQFFSYDYVLQGVHIQILIGGRYSHDTGLDEVGYAVWMFDVTKQEATTVENYLGGYAARFIGSDGAESPWFTNGKAFYGIDW